MATLFFSHCRHCGKVLGQIYLTSKRLKRNPTSFVHKLDSTDGWCVVSYSCEQHRYAPNHRERWHGKQILNKLYEHIHITNHFITEYAFYAGNKERFIKRTSEALVCMEYVSLEVNDYNLCLCQLDSIDGWCVVSYDCEQHRYDEYDHKERSHDKILHSQLVEHFHITDYTVTEYVFYDEMRERYIDYQFQNKKRCVESKRPDCSNQSAPDPIISDAYMFNDTEDIAESLRVNSPSVSTTSKRKYRKKSKQFFRGSDLSFQEYSTDTSSRESSRAPSPDRSDLGESYNTKQKIEILRHHYGENWLQAYTTQHGSPLTTSENRNHSKETDTIDGVVPSTKDYGKTDDDFYLNDSTVKTSSQDDDFVVLTNCETNDKSNTELLNGFKEIAIDDETCVVEVDREVEVDMEVKDVKDKVAPSLSLYNRLNSTRGVEWTRSDSEQQELYGPESDPFICHLMSSATDIRPVIISVNDRYIIEKDLNGSVIEMLDVKCMETLEEVHDYVSHEDFGDNILLPVIIISFDYVKKDRQNRSYIMEDDNSSKQLTDLLEPALNRKKAEKQGQKLQCLKCSRIFLPSEAKLLSNVDDEYISLKKPYSSSSEDYQTRYSCLSCKSGMVVRLVAENVLQSSDATPVGSAVSTSSQPESFMKQLRNSFLTSTPRNSPNHLSVSVGKSKTDDYSNYSKSNSEQKSDLNSTVEVDSNILLSDKTCYSTKMTSNLSLPDLRRASTGQIGVHQQSFPVEESDISVLRNPSQSSIAAISSTDIMTDSVTERDKDKNYLHSDSVGRLDRLTPVGSPLSTDVCSSMVSSVYENSLTVEGESDANACTNSVDIYNTEDLSDTVKSAHHSEFNNTGYHSDEKKSGDEGLDVSANLEESVLDSPNIEVLSSTNDYQDLFKESNVTLDNSENLTLNTEEFTEVDHRLKLYFMMHLFEDDDDIHCFIECDIVQYKVKASFRGILLVSTRKIFILKIKDGDHRNEAPDLWLTQADCQPITEVQYVDIGLGYQSFRLEFSLENLCYTFIIRDEGRCKRYLSLFTGIVQSFAFDDKSKLKGISKYNATTSENLWQQVLWRDGESDDLDGVVNIEEEKLVKYLMAYLIDDALQTPSPVSLVITATELCLVIENHHYLPPHAIVDNKKSGSKGTQFQLKEIQKINNIATVELADEDLKQLRLTFFNEESSDECCWHIIMETTNGILSLVEAIRGPWESEFGIDLEVTKTSFCEESSF